jgi:putative acetyltransferase
MSSPSSALVITRADPREPEPAALIHAMTKEIKEIYGHHDGSGNFKPEDVLVPRSGFYVGRVDGEAVVCGGFRPLEQGIAEIKRMYVVPEHRGRGHSKVMLALLERMAKESGYEVARLETRSQQEAAVSLYEGTGYVRIPNYGAYVGQEGCICYEKSLARAGVARRIPTGE